jgi:hypothetical protein
MNRIIAAITTIALFAAPSAALAQGAATDAYGGKGGAVLGVTDVKSGAGNPNGGGAVLGVTEVETQSGSAAAPGAGTQGVTAGANPAGGSVATPTATGDVASGSLPFTGLDLALIAAGGLMLVGMGFAMRRVSRPTVS